MHGEHVHHAPTLHAPAPTLHGPAFHVQAQSAAVGIGPFGVGVQDACEPPAASPRIVGVAHVPATAPRVASALCLRP